MNGTCNGTTFGVPASWGLEEVPKGQISLNFNHKVNFKDFLNPTLFVFSQMKDMKNIRQDFHSVPWVMPQGLGRGGAAVKNLIF